MKDEGRTCDIYFILGFLCFFSPLRPGPTLRIGVGSIRRRGSRSFQRMACEPLIPGARTSRSAKTSKRSPGSREVGTGQPRTATDAPSSRWIVGSTPGSIGRSVNRSGLPVIIDTRCRSVRSASSSQRSSDALITPRHGHGHSHGHVSHRENHRSLGGYYERKAMIIDELVELSEQRVRSAYAAIHRPIRMSFAHR